MSEIILVRHGQANTGAQDEESYDKLSALGHQQADWLGAYFRDHNMEFDRRVTGSLTRHVETHESMGFAKTDVDSRLNEMAYFPLAEAMERHSGLPVPHEPEDFADHIPQTMAAWRENHLHEAPESWDGFHGRVAASLDELTHKDHRVLVVTSGGVISSVIMRILGLEISAMCSMLLQIRNSSIHTIRKYRGGLHLHGFNATPHLAHPDRAHALTFV